VCVVAQDRRSGRASVVAESGRGGDGGGGRRLREVTGEGGSWLSKQGALALIDGGRSLVGHLAPAGGWWKLSCVWFSGVGDGVGVAARLKLSSSIAGTES
jgi:hypothetical protein